MTRTSTSEPGIGGSASRRGRDPLYNALIGLTALSILLQAIWAGIFLEHDGKRDDAQSWIDVHSHGGEVALALGVLPAVVAVVRLRYRRDLLIGSIVLAVLLALESYLGGLIVDQDKETLAAVHIPLGVAIMGLAVWLPTRAAQHSRAA